MLNAIINVQLTLNSKKVLTLHDIEAFCPSRTEIFRTETIGDSENF